MRRFTVVFTVIVSAFFLSGVFESKSVQAQEKPNVVLIVMDNLGWGEIG